MPGSALEPLLTIETDASVADPLIKIPLPSPPRFPEITTSSRFAVPRLYNPPPPASPAVFCDKVALVSMSVAPPTLKIPPPAKLDPAGISRDGDVGQAE